MHKLIKTLQKITANEPSTQNTQNTFKKNLIATRVVLKTVPEKSKITVTFTINKDKLEKDIQKFIKDELAHGTSEEELKDYPKIARKEVEDIINSMDYTKFYINSSGEIEIPNIRYVSTSIDYGEWIYSGGEVHYEQIGNYRITP